MGPHMLGDCRRTPCHLQRSVGHLEPKSDVNLERITAEREELDRAAAQLKRRGWRVRVVMTRGDRLATF